MASLQFSIGSLVRPSTFNNSIDTTFYDTGKRIYLDELKAGWYPENLKTKFYTGVITCVFGRNAKTAAKTCYNSQQELLGASSRNSSFEVTACGVVFYRGIERDPEGNWAPFGNPIVDKDGKDLIVFYKPSNLLKIESIIAYERAELGFVLKSGDKYLGTVVQKYRKSIDTKLTGHLIRMIEFETAKIVTISPKDKHEYIKVIKPKEEEKDNDNIKQ